jgi:hypothetical protein
MFANVRGDGGVFDRRRNVLPVTTASWQTKSYFSSISALRL